MQRKRREATPIRKEHPAHVLHRPDAVDLRPRHGMASALVVANRRAAGQKGLRLGIGRGVAMLDRRILERDRTDRGDLLYPADLARLDPERFNVCSIGRNVLLLVAKDPQGQRFEFFWFAVTDKGKD